ncbi:MAG TPA: DUF2142 domain-containing protein [Solirubrobacteraceae bacterium]|jgi:4-amino-4-deoxy-L-arabinose transferase-like glycosyltransferase
MNAVCWSIVVPPLEVPDEPEHVAYVKQLAETGHLPKPTGAFSTEEGVTLEFTHLQQVAQHPQFHTIASRRENEELQSALQRAAGEPRNGNEYGGVASGQPPLYYALQSIPYTLASGGTLLDRIQLMRFFSALFGGLTALFGYLFVREALPRTRSAWLVGGMAVALMPLLGEMSGAVSPDSMLFAVSAAVFYLLARGFRRGFTRKLAFALGAATAIGLMTKLNFAGLVPGVILGMVVLAYRRIHVDRREAAISLAISLGIGLSPAFAYLAIEALSGSGTTDVIKSVVNSTQGSLTRELSYIWQTYLPRLPGMTAYFPGLSPIRQAWFDGYVGQYGWLDTSFPGWVETLALIPAVAIVCLLLRELAVCRAALRGRASEIVVYAAIAVGLLVLIGATSYTGLTTNFFEYGQMRYLLPLLPLFGMAIALATRGVGKRWGPAVGALLITLFLAHDILSQLQTVARFYG